MERLMTRKEVAEFLGVQPGTLARWKWAGTDCPPCVKVGRSVRYRRSDVEAWLWKRAGVSEAAVTMIQRTTAERH